MIEEVLATPACVTVPMKVGKRSGDKVNFASKRTLVQVPVSVLSSCVTLGRSLHFLTGILFSAAEIMPSFGAVMGPKRESGCKVFI